MSQVSINHHGNTGGHASAQHIFGVWNSNHPFEEYVPDFTKPSRCVQDKCAHMLHELVSLFKHIRSCQYLPNINMVEKMDELQKLNKDFLQFWMSTLVQIYGSQTSWRIRNTCTVICQTSQTEYK